MNAKSAGDAVEAELALLRQQINAVDDALLQLINQRAMLALKVGEVKQQEGDRPIFYRPEREVQVLKRVQEANPGPLHNEVVARLFREVMSACLAIEKPMTIAYLGPEGTFTQTAALKHFGHAVLTRPLKSIDAVFRDVAAGSADYGVVPVENSTEGVINHTLDGLVHATLKICGEVELRIHHHLMSHLADLTQIRRIYSHPQSLAQCRQWLNRHLPEVVTVEASSNAEAARLAAAEPGSAAIAGEAAALIYGLPMLMENIEDNPNNTTRFLVLGPTAVPPSGQDKTVLLLSARNKPGALFDLLEPLARHRISMTRIESRPSQQGMWDYLFFVDLEGHCDDAQLAPALAELRAEASLFKIIGSFPKAVI
ncbi:MAG: prephenate dehydratase [Gammaproteobacteria bacterium]|nr:prephenate dehydratase [Gammaproteobacteria bacterium]